MHIEEILIEIGANDGKCGRKQVKAALEKKKEIIPHLISILEAILEDVETYLRREDYESHVNAVMLLTHWQVVEVHSLLVDVFSLPTPIISELFEDTIIEELPIILLKTCGGSLEKIKELIANNNADEFSRGAAITAITYAVLEGLITREDALFFLSEFLNGDYGEKGAGFYSMLVDSMCDLYPEEVMDRILEAYEQEIIDNNFVYLEEFDQIFQDGKEECFGKLKKKYSEQSLYDLNKSVEWWISSNYEYLHEYSHPYQYSYRYED